MTKRVGQNLGKEKLVNTIIALKNSTLLLD